MGSLFSKFKKKESRITEHDKVILQLKQQRDKLKQYQKRITINLEKERDIAKTLLKDGKKEKAKLLLRKKRFTEQMLTKTDGQLINLEQMVHDLEFAQIEMQIVDGLKNGNIALKKMHELLSIEDIEKILDETREGIDKQNEIDELLSGNLTQDDEDAVLNELEAIIAESMPTIPDKEIKEEIAFPEVPKEEPKEEKKPERERIPLPAT